MHVSIPLLTDTPSTPIWASTRSNLFHSSRSSTLSSTSFSLPPSTFSFHHPPSITPPNHSLPPLLLPSSFQWMQHWSLNLWNPLHDEWNRWLSHDHLGPSLRLFDACFFSAGPLNHLPLLSSSFTTILPVTLPSLSFLVWFEILILGQLAIPRSSITPSTSAPLRCLFILPGNSCNHLHPLDKHADDTVDLCLFLSSSLIPSSLPHSTWNWFSSSSPDLDSSLHFSVIILSFPSLISGNDSPSNSTPWIPLFDALQSLSSGGSLVLSFPPLCDVWMAELLFILSGWFDHLSIHRSSIDHPLFGRRFLVASRFRRYSSIDSRCCDSSFHNDPSITFLTVSSSSWLQWFLIRSQSMSDFERLQFIPCHFLLRLEEILSILGQQQLELIDLILNSFLQFSLSSSVHSSIIPSSNPSSSPVPWCYYSTHPTTTTTTTNHSSPTDDTSLPPDSHPISPSAFLFRLLLQRLFLWNQQFPLLPSDFFRQPSLVLASA